VTVRPTYVGGLRLYRDSIFSSYFARYPRSSLNGTQPKPATYSEVSAISKYISDIWGIPPTNRGPQNNSFRGLRNLTANLTTYVFGTKHHIHNRAGALATRRGLLHRLKTTMNFGPQTAIGAAFCRPYANSAFYCIARLRKRNSTKLCLTVDSKSC